MAEKDQQILELKQELERIKAQGNVQFDAYQTVLTRRYCSAAMSELFSQRSRIGIWRKLWLALAESERALGIDTISLEALEEMRSHLYVTDSDFEIARIEEKKRRHHVHAFGIVAPAAAGIIHYGATSCFVTDNAELVIMRDALDILLNKLSKVVWNLSNFAMKWKEEPTLAYTHLQPAQLITVGKRAAQWVQDLMFDLRAIEQVRNDLKFRGAQGTTGTQYDFSFYFQGDSSKCDQLNALLCTKLGFPSCYDISTQTYTRKVDLIVANAVSGLGATAQKICGDIRHLANWKEIEEPFESREFHLGEWMLTSNRSPMRSERVYSLARELMSKPANFANTLSDQWAERTLDDSAIRRMDIPDMFLLAEAILLGLDNITDGLVVYPKRIQSRVQEELPFMITESIIMKLVAKGASRQDAHEEIRVLSHQAGSVVKNEGKSNDLVSRIKSTEFFKPIWGELDGMLDPRLYTGRSVEIVERYCGVGGPVELRLVPYMKYITESSTAELSV
ncbi:L-Aspartase-like protein [Xylaria arbuscula]|nr:L-Aspartase-like protein [Xylaria arbuscula]